MSALARISSLLRELAEAFDQLDEERSTPKRLKRPVEAPSSEVDVAAVARVRRGLRRSGVKA